MRKTDVRERMGEGGDGAGVQLGLTCGMTAGTCGDKLQPCNC